MKEIGKSILIGLAVVIVEWVFLPLFLGVFDGMSETENLMIGIGFFLAFEMAFCTSLILAKRKDRE